MRIISFWRVSSCRYWRERAASERTARSPTAATSIGWGLRTENGRWVPSDFVGLQRRRRYTRATWYQSRAGWRAGSKGAAGQHWAAMANVRRRDGVGDGQSRIVYGNGRYLAWCWTLKGLRQSGCPEIYILYLWYNCDVMTKRKQSGKFPL